MKLLPLLAGLFLCVQAEAQIQKFIEVTVTDSIHVNPNTYVYRISDAGITDELNPSFATHGKSGKVERKKSSLMDTVLQELTKMKFNILPAPIESSARVSPFPMEVGLPVLVVLLRSADSLLALSEYVRLKKRLSGILIHIDRQDDASYHERLYKKLIDAAQAKADMLASYTHQKVLAVLSITELPEKPAATGGWTSYPPLSALAAYDNVIPGWHTTVSDSSESFDNSYAVSAKLVVRFATQ